MDIMGLCMGLTSDFAGVCVRTALHDGSEPAVELLWGEGRYYHRAPGRYDGEAVLLLGYFEDVFHEDPALGLRVLPRLEVAEGQLGLVGSL
jgi:hypothetical protein